MKRMLSALAVSAVVALPAAAVAAQSTSRPADKAKPSTSSQSSQGSRQSSQQPEMPKPGPEHEVLKKDVGTWEASVEMTGPDGQVTKSNGTETVRMLGFWQVTDFKGELMGQTFEGVGETTYDPTKKKYTGTWIDSMTPGYSTVESDYDGKAMSGTMQGPDMSGKMTKMRATTEWKDDGTRVFTVYGPKNDSGKEPVSMRITYRRRK
jgi:hypothetical protein